jgi:hypothetical protein
MNITKKLIASLVVFSTVGNVLPAWAAASAPKMVSVTLHPEQKPPIRYEGSLSDKHILMVISQQDTNYEGAYAYVKLGSSEPLRWIDLSGRTSKNGVVVLTEKVGRKVTGTFSGTFTANVFSGTWRSPLGKTLNFSASRAGTSDDLKIVARIENVSDDTTLRGIDIYKGEKLTQSLPANAVIFTRPDDLRYDNRDLNFDGYPDLSLPVENDKQLHWFFDPRQNRYVVAPESLQKVNVTAAEYSSNELFEEWDHGAEAKGANTYKFVDGKYCLIEVSKALGEPEKAKLSTKRYPVSQCRSKAD